MPKKIILASLITPKKPAKVGAKAHYPGFIEPQLAKTISTVPSAQRWVHEVKFDDYRIQVHLRDERVNR
jgi:bifunctional non-homologous end joining protein LigD